MWDSNFRGVSFGVKDSDYKGGRRTAVHEFIGKDVPFVEDLGGKAIQFTIEGFVVGSDYETKRDQLLEALQTPGSGTLVHPYYGEKTVQVVEFSVKESSENGGMAVFSMTFADTSEKVEYPKTANNEIQQISDSSAIVDEAVGVSAEKGLQLSDTVVFADYVNSIQETMDIIRKEMDKSMTFIDDVDEYLNEMNDFFTDIVDISRTPWKLITKVQNIFKKFGSILDTFFEMNVKSAYSNARIMSGIYNSKSGFSSVKSINNENDMKKLKMQSNINMYNSVNKYYSSKEYKDSASGYKKKENDNVLAVAFKSAALTEIVSNAPLIQYDTVTDALTVQEKIVSIIDDIIVNVDNDDLYYALLDLKTLTFKTVPYSDEGLKNIKQIDITESVPVIAFLYQRYGNIDNYEDVIFRNNIENPLEVENRTIEVLE